MAKKKPVYIFVSGGVISGLGKGVVTSSLSLLLKSYGFKVAPVKCDAYVNIDAGTIRPQEHGEVFVCEDGIETDQDLGHYERFIDENLSRANYITTGQVYQEVIRKERAFAYEGEDVEVVPHIPEEMIRRFRAAGEEMDADFVLVEIGGTVGEYQNILFMEANRILKVREKEPVIHIHVSYLPTPKTLGEMKTKPVQTSVRTLNETGIQPDFIIGRSSQPMDQQRKDKIALACNIDVKNVISNPDIDSVYKVPFVLDRQQLVQKILRQLKMSPRRKHDMTAWRAQVDKMTAAKKTGKLNPDARPKIGVVGKYQNVGDFSLSDAYISVVEAIQFAGWHFEVDPEIVWIDSGALERKKSLDKDLGGLAAIIVPGGFGERGTEGMLRAIKYARENKIPYLGLCYGLQLAVIEYSRNVLGLKSATSTEINPRGRHQVIHLMPAQEKKMLDRDYGATMRLGGWKCWLHADTLISRTYAKYGWANKAGKKVIWERHRHRYEVNNKYRKKLEKAGLVISGTTTDSTLVEAIELPKKVHPYFVATQFHPEFKARFLRPHPLFLGLIEAALSLKGS